MVPEDVTQLPNKGLCEEFTRRPARMYKRYSLDDDPDNFIVVFDYAKVVGMDSDYNHEGEV